MTVPDPHTAAILARDEGPTVDRSTAALQRYLAAAARAKHKGLHWGLPSSLALDPDVGTYCRGQLRTAYVRRPGWTSIGIHCDGCAAFWPDPSATALGR